jgi:TLC domain
MAEHPYSADFMQTEGLDWLSIALLRGVAQLDRWGAWTWNLRHVAIMTALSLGSVRLIFQKYRGIDWYAFIHAVVSASGSFACLYLNFVSSEQLTGMSEPLRSIQCHGPLTSLHRILPAITMGYSIFDFLDGLTISVDFVIHGAVTFAVMAFFVEINGSHIMAPMLFMEGSTVFLTVVKADFFPDSMVVLNQACFVISFFLCRLVVVPYFWVHLIRQMYDHRNDARFQNCFPSYFMYACFLFGMFYNMLNSYWFVKIVRKARRRMLGIEKPTERNNLADEAGNGFHAIKKSQ